MIKQIDMKKALEMYQKGQEIKILVHGEKEGWESAFPTTLNKMFQGCLFFVDAPAIVNEQLEAVLRPVTRRLTKDAKEMIQDMYRAGKELEEISQEMGYDMVLISRYIDQVGLGELRYQGESIPSSGSAPIRSVTTGLRRLNENN